MSPFTIYVGTSLLLGMWLARFVEDEDDKVTRWLINGGMPVAVSIILLWLAVGVYCFGGSNPYGKFAAGFSGLCASFVVAFALHNIYMKFAGYKRQRDRKKAHMNIWRMRDKRNYQGLIDALDNEDLNSLASNALVELGALAVEPILNSISEWNQIILSRRQERCSVCGEPNTIGAGYCRNNLRFRIEVLNRLPDSRSILVLLDTLVDARINMEIPQEIIDKFKEQEGELLLRFGRGEYDLRWGIESTQLDHLRAHLFPPAYQAKLLTKAAFDAIITIGTPTIQPIIAALNDGRSSVRYTLVSLLTHIGGSEANAALKQMLNDPNESVREKVMESLDQVKE